MGAAKEDGKVDLKLKTIGKMMGLVLTPRIQWLSAAGSRLDR